MRSRHLIVALAGLVGAAGVALGAVAAHRVQDPGLATASQMLVLHAAAVVGVSAHLRSVHQRPMPLYNVWVLGAALLLAGASLFGGDIALRTLMGARLFPMAAPLGGTTMIAGWLVVSLAAVLGLRGGGK